ncbi:MAG: helix-hairpin-helix domain-containing protein [Synergistaceae bacterium]|nr:helix-hairpin-helix domain-containing protein [Synergistaceae bacterium]
MNNNKFDSRKVIITGAGIIIFLLAGVLTMFMIPYNDNNNNSKPEKIPVQSQQINNQVIQANNKPENLEPPANNNNIKSDWFIYVTGAVKTPGVYKLSEDSRIFQAIDAAGGFTSKADRASINLAERLMDGMHIHIAQKGAAQKTPAQPQQLIRIPGVQENNIISLQPVQVSQVSKRANNANNNNNNLIDINNASVEELQKLIGIGPALAKRIIEYRQSHGKFTKPDDLIQVKGIGPAKLKKMKDQILIR